MGYIFCLILIFFILLDKVKAETIPDFSSQSVTQKAEPETRLIKEVIIEGNTVFSQVELKEVIQEFIDQSFSVDNIQQIIFRLREFYHQNGYITSDVYAQANQDFSSGIVQISIVEGILERVEIKGLKTLNPNYVLNRLPSANSVLNIFQIEKDLLLLQQNQLLFKQITSNLNRGILPQNSILVVNIVENYRFDFSVEINNYGAYNSGRNQLESSFAVNNVTGNGDRFKTKFILSSGSKQILADYTIPVNSDNAELRFHYDYGDSEIITQPLARFNIDGVYQQGFIEWRQPLKQTVREKWLISLQAGIENSRSFLDGKEFSFVPQVPDSGYTIYNFRLSTDYFRSFSGSAIASRAEITVGWDSLSNTNDPFTIFRLQSNYLNQLDELVLFSTTVSAQFSTSTLAGGAEFGTLPSEQFPIGGINSVPGYDLYLRRGDNGINAIVQLYTTIYKDADWGKMQLVPFFAYGKVWNESFSIPPPQNLASTGIEWIWNVNDWSLRLGVALPLVRDVNPDFRQEFYFSVGKRIAF